MHKPYKTTADNRFETACDYGGNAIGFSRWKVRPALTEYYPLCDFCFPGGDIPERITHLIRSTSHGSSSERNLHLAQQDKPDGWDVADRGNGRSEYGGPTLANALKDPNVTTFDDVAELIGDD